MASLVTLAVDSDDARAIRTTLEISPAQNRQLLNPAAYRIDETNHYLVAAIRLQGDEGERLTFAQNPLGDIQLGFLQFDRCPGVRS